MDTAKLISFVVMRSGAGVKVVGKTEDGRTVNMTGLSRVEIERGEPAIAIRNNAERVPLG